MLRGSACEERRGVQYHRPVGPCLGVDVVYRRGSSGMLRLRAAGAEGRFDDSAEMRIVYRRGQRRHHRPPRSGPLPARHAVVRWLFAPLAALCLSGCAKLFDADYYTDYRQPPEGLREVSTVLLEEMSQSKPVTLEEATADAARRTLAVEEPPESLELELADVRAAALASNLDLKVELVNPSIARETVSEEEARFEALLFGSVAHERIDHPPVLNRGPGARSRYTEYDLGVRIPLRTGGEVTVDLPFSRYSDRVLDNPSDGSPKIINPAYEAALRFSISQPLLRDAGIRTNTHGIRIAKYERDIADARTKLEAIRILAGADRAYWLLYAARRELEVSQQQYELSLQQFDEARQRVAARAAAEIEIMRAESGVASRLESIIIAHTAVRRRERDLKRVMNRDGLPMNSPTALIPTTAPNPLGLELDADALAEFAVANRMEMLELELRLAIDASTVDFERNGTLPLCVLDYSYTLNGLAGGFHGAFEHVDDGSYADHAIGVIAEIPLGNRAARSRLHRALLQRVQRLATRDQRRLAIRQEVYDVIDALEQAWQQILAARQEVVLTARTYRAEKRQFELGLRTSTDVLQAQDLLARAQSREIRALAGYEISQVDIAFACGALLGRGKVDWAPVGLN